MRPLPLLAALILAATPAFAAPPPPAPPRYGQVGKMTVQPGQRDAVIALLLAGSGGMPGCISYTVAKDAGEADAIWISEVWDSKASHDASLALPAVRAAIAKARPLITGFPVHAETIPVEAR